MEVPSTTILDILTQHEPLSFQHETPIIWEQANGWWVYDNKGNRYLDFTSGIFVANIGHRHPRVEAAIIEQSMSMIHSYIFPTEVRAKLVKKLCDITGFEKVYLCSTGSEAVEAAIRCMQAYTGRHDIEGMESAFHGRTAGCKAILKDLSPPRSEVSCYGGLIIESYFGYNEWFHNRDWTQHIVADARSKGIPVCFDEIQAGFGRTGKLFGYQWYGVKPDLIVVGKALGGGLPISAVLGSAKLLDAPDDLSSTHSGNPVCCAAALATLEVLEDEKLVELAGMREWIREELRTQYPQYEINGHGMLWGIDLKDIDMAIEVVNRCAEHRLLLVQTHRGTIKLGPPLTMPEEKIMTGLQILKGVIDEVASHRHSS